ncbi:MAG TPA: glycosyltransferase [Thermoanaerobaculia bacterium]|nr:glycosyltransferase [Thermoanaerobaculia bacterium]
MRPFPFSIPLSLAARLPGRRAAPLPLEGDARRVPPDEQPGPVDVVVPVCGAPDELGRCLRSLLATTDVERHRLVLVLDGPQPPATGELAARLAAERPAGVLVLENPARQGFVASVNRAMAGSRRDVVLLNSDTQVGAGWLEKLQRAAYSAPEIATATPFSNNATICSLPRFLEANALPAGWDVERFGSLVEASSRRLYPRLPTGVGVCLYLKRKALDQLGLFDRARFGVGYGEESEFCMRALKAGYAHVLDDATFVYHEGHRSFGTSRHARVDAAHRTLARLHPEYLATVDRFLRDDPLRPLRERIVGQLAPRRRAARPGGPARVLHVVHGWPPWNHAGTELYAAWLARWQAACREVTVWSRIGDPARALGDAVELLDGGVRVRLLVRNFDEADPLSRNALWSRRLAADFERLLAEARPELVHVHHLAGHAAALVGTQGPLARRRLPVLFQLQDWWPLCARSNLCDHRRELCSGPAAGKCAACLPLTGVRPRRLLNRLLYVGRAALGRRALRRADAFVVGSRFIRDSYLELGWLRPGDPVAVLPYGIEPPGGPAAVGRKPRAAGSPLRFGVIGSILPHKGIHVAVSAFAGIDPGRARLAVWGDPAIDPGYTSELERLGIRGAGGPAAAVSVRGRFTEESKAEIFAGLDVLIVPSLGLESFGLVAREAMYHGVPVLASRRGALAEMLADGRGGALFEPADAAELARWVERLCAEPELLDRWRRELPPVKLAERHAEEIEEVYERLLAARRPRP